MLRWNNSNSKIKNVEVIYLGEKIFQDEDIIENILIFKRRNALHLKFGLLVPTTVNMNIYKQIKDMKINSIEKFLDFYIKVVVDSFIFIYNKTNPKSYLTKYRVNAIGISNNIYKKNIYKVKFEIYGKMEFIYFDIDESQFFL